MGRHLAPLPPNHCTTVGNNLCVAPTIFIGVAEDKLLGELGGNSRFDGALDYSELVSVSSTLSRGEWKASIVGSSY